MKTACFVALAATAGVASAFVTPTAFTGASVATVKSATNMKMSYENAEGAQAPLGFFDPLGLLNDADEARFNRLRYVEVKHGRISMLAVLGHIVQQNYRFGGYLSTSENIKFSDVPNGLAAFSKIPAGGIWQIIAFIGFLELFIMRQKPGSTPGDMLPGVEPNWEKFDDATKSRKRSIELNNGRAAQMGILALMVHEKLDGHPYVINDLLGWSYSFN